MVELPDELLAAMPPVKIASEVEIWFGMPDKLADIGIVRDANGLWNFWYMGPRSSRYRWDGAVRDFANVEKHLVMDESIVIRHRLRPKGPMLVPFYLADRNYLRPVAEGGPSVDGFTMGSVEYGDHGVVPDAHRDGELFSLEFGDHGVVPAAYRDGELFSVGGCALPSVLKASTFPVEQFYEELASPQGGEIFMINPPASRGA